MVVATRRKTAPGPSPRAPELAAHPSEEELITCFLRPRVASSSSGGGSPPCAFIHDADVYSADPAELTCGFAPALASNGDRAWYFFSAVRAKTRDGQRKARTVESGEGCWHSEASARPVLDGAGRCLGHRQSFSFVTKVDGRRVRSGWLMVELGLDDADDVVLCKVYFSPRARPAGGSSAASSAGRKRKAAAVAAADDRSSASAARHRCRGSPAEEDDDVVTSADVEERGSTRDDGGLAGGSPAAGSVEELYPDDGSFFNWWMRNRDGFMVQYNIVDRPDEELQKTLGSDKILELLEYDLEKFSDVPVHPRLRKSSGRPRPNVSSAASGIRQ